MNQQGQAYLETVIGLFVVLGMIATLGAVLGGFMTSLAGHHLLYEMLVCQETFQAENCSRATKERLKAVILLGDIQEFRSVRGVDHSSADVRIKYSFLSALLPRLVFYLNIHESIRVPLAGRENSK